MSNPEKKLSLCERDVCYVPTSPETRHALSLQRLPALGCGHGTSMTLASRLLASCLPSPCLPSPSLLSPASVPPASFSPVSLPPAHFFPSHTNITEAPPIMSKTPIQRLRIFSPKNHQDNTRVTTIPSMDTGSATLTSISVMARRRKR